MMLDISTLLVFRCELDGGFSLKIEFSLCEFFSRFFFSRFFSSFCFKIMRTLRTQVPGRFCTYDTLTLFTNNNQQKNIKNIDASSLTNTIIIINNEQKQTRAFRLNSRKGNDLYGSVNDTIRTSTYANSFIYF